MAIPFRSNAISGSLTHLVDGTSYLVEGANITITSQSNGQVSIASSGGGSVAGSDRQIQFNDGGAFGASANLAFDSNSLLKLTGSLHISSSVEGDDNPLLRIDHENATGTKPIFFVSGSGLVAIGTDTPREDSVDTNRLHILGEGGADQGQNPVNNTLLMLENNDHAGVQFMTPSTKSGFLVWGDPAAANVAHFYFLHNDNRFHFDSAYGNEAMTVRASGDSVNMGTNNSAHMLTDKASLHISSSTEGEDTGGPVLLKIDHENASNILFVTGSGRVGIGTNNPLVDLDVKDDTDATARIGRANIGAVTSGVSDYAYFSHRDHASVNNYALQQRSNGTTLLNAPAGGVLSFRVGNVSTAMIIDGGNNNNIGINGTPAARLHVQASVPEKDVFRCDGDINNILYVSGSGKVGIGTGTPSDKFTVFGNTLDDRVFFLSGSGGAGSANEQNYSDINFFVSGSAGSKNSSTKGTALFGGDLVVSGTLHGGSPLKIGSIPKYTVQSINLGTGGSATITPTAPVVFLDAASITGSPFVATMSTTGYTDGETVKFVVTTDVNVFIVFSGILTDAATTFQIPDSVSGKTKGASFELIYVSSASKWAVLNTNGLPFIA